ncbi:membrane protein [Massilia sp. WF1]|uniref:HupE/UreJ family protein n=1 Tax=unclassified Massilia TaxID=2609279 RepID=UPI00064A95C9|nr:MULTISPECIES: HupE/UreJ family protein [unclassified Massilia]ALK97472.1 hypothetical protein AM586_15815 [Massilia sp. WG5]KLU36654.1 membrane protein [Massilia sp. WF1]
MKRLAILFLALLALAAPAWAHKPSDSYLSLDESARTGAPLQGRWDIALRDLDYAIGLDGDGDGRLTWDEVRGRHAAIAAYALARLHIARGGVPCSLTAGPQLIDSHTDGAYTVLRFSAACPGAGPLALDYRLFADIDPQHKGLLNVSRPDGTHTLVLGSDRPGAVLEQGAAGGFASFVREGIWHIWIGYDHILFLLSLLLPAVLVWHGQRWQAVSGLRPALGDVLRIVTAFTVAHSITLSIAALGIVQLPSRWVESAIALSVLLAALNNLSPVTHGRRWVAAFGFGLVHGFGFANVLADLGLRAGALAVPLVGFNLGVEIGQLAIVAVFLPLAYALRGTRLYQRGILAGGSGLVMLVAAIWLGERLFDLRLLPA